MYFRLINFEKGTSGYWLAAKHTLTSIHPFQSDSSPPGKTQDSPSISEIPSGRFISTLRLPGIYFASTRDYPLAHKLPSGKILRKFYFLEFILSRHRRADISATKYSRGNFTATSGPDSSSRHTPEGRSPSRNRCHHGLAESKTSFPNLIIIKNTIFS